jgi:hypothetical protein
VLCERNNHGHAVLLALRGVGGITLLSGHDGKEGWMSCTLGKTQMYDNCADAFKNQEVVVHSFGTFSQLASIDGNTLRAPDGEHDDKADAFALAVCARLALLGSGDDEYEPVLGAAGKAVLWPSGGFDGSFY